MGMGEWSSQSAAEKTTTIGVRIPAELEQLTMLRALAETVALIADFAIDEVVDIRLALDEVATSLILEATPGSTLDSDFTYNDHEMFVRVSAVAVSEKVVGQAGFGWHIVRTLTQSISAAQEPFDSVISGYPTVVDFSWARSGDGG